MKRMNMSVILSCLLTLMVLSGGGRGTETGMVLHEMDEATANESNNSAAEDAEQTVYAYMEDHELVIKPENNTSARAWVDLLRTNDLTVSMHDYGGFEKVGPIGTDLPREDETITTEPGDVILYQGNQITIYYGVNTWTFTRLGKVQGLSQDELKTALGDGDLEVVFTLNRRGEPDLPTPTPSEDTVQMYRMYNPNSGEHFYTGNAQERDMLVKTGWNFEGVGFRAPKSSSTPMYRLYNENAGDHHYTSSKEERDYLVRIGWKEEGIGWYADDAQGVAMYRLYNPNCIGAGSHHYTSNAQEKAHLIGIGWKDEGIGFYACK